MLPDVVSEEREETIETVPILPKKQRRMAERRKEPIVAKHETCKLLAGTLLDHLQLLQLLLLLLEPFYLFFCSHQMVPE